MNDISTANMILNLPYTSLRAFEAVVRHATFSSAADELGVSQSAVSQHVKLLEEWLGQQLMLRGARRSVPTKEGARLAQSIARGLGQISEVCEEIRDKKRADNTIVIGCLPGFAFIWLFPRLMRFDLAHPALSISITTDTGVTPFSGAEADIGIRYGPDNHPGFHVERLMGEELFPVCAPSLLDGQCPLKTVADLEYHTILRDELLNTAGTPPSWEFWASANGVTLPRGARVRSFGQSNMVIQAAIQGVGIALGRGPLVIDALQDGRLVRPFRETARSQYSYWLVCSARARKTAKIELFVDWIMKEADDQPSLPEWQDQEIS